MATTTYTIFGADGSVFAETTDATVAQAFSNIGQRVTAEVTA